MPLNEDWQNSSARASLFRAGGCLSYSFRFGFRRFSLQRAHRVRVRRVDRTSGVHFWSLLGNYQAIERILAASRFLACDCFSTSLLVVHSLAFVAILRTYPHWRVIWFMPVVIVEGGLFGAILYLLFGGSRHQEPQNDVTNQANR